jgi:hypothetical protein
MATPSALHGAGKDTLREMLWNTFPSDNTAASAKFKFRPMNQPVTLQHTRCCIVTQAHSMLKIPQLLVFSEAESKNDSAGTETICADAR